MQMPNSHFTDQKTVPNRGKNPLMQLAAPYEISIQVQNMSIIAESFSSWEVPPTKGIN